MADYADCGFGSSGATRTEDRNEAGGELPATAVEVESAVLEHFPEEQREDAPFPTKVRCGSGGACDCGCPMRKAIVGTGVHCLRVGRLLCSDWWGKFVREGPFFHVVCGSFASWRDGR